MMGVVHKVTTWSLSLALTLAIPAAAASKQGRLSGNVLDVGKAEITIEKGTVHRVVEFSASTNFTTADAKASATSADQVKPGNYLTCIGSWDGVKLAASKCTVRPAKRP